MTKTIIRFKNLCAYPHAGFGDIAEIELEKISVFFDDSGQEIGRKTEAATIAENSEALKNAFADLNINLLERIEEVQRWESERVDVYAQLESEKANHAKTKAELNELKAAIEAL